MALCDMCGKETRLRAALIEGTELNVCEKCGKFGKTIRKNNYIHQTKKTRIKEKEIEEEVIERIVKDYGNLIKDAREKINLKQEDFAKKINEKVSLIHNIESGHHEPNIKLAQKIEKFLKIKLIEEGKLEKTELKTTKSETLTIGDLIKLKK
ncbi:TIGR00270 family protein [Candidatus Woesearchaeota archaeon B3_Woes]|nr:MAG: TIGR00270 family protein [Candidatus Woesearchaeota archaeon B3_Woes]